MVASTNGERIAQHWETLKELCKVTQKALFLDADMCVDSCSYKIQDVLMKHRTEFRICALNHLLGLANGEALLNQREFHVLQLFLRESKLKHACDCCGGEHARNGISRIENSVHKMKKTLRLANSGEMLLQLSKDAADGKRIAIACGSVHDAESLQAFVRHYATGQVGLYTGKTDNSNHFIDLKMHWDPLQVIIYTSTLTTGADYCTPVDRFYVFPHHNTCTPRDMHQMLGRIRELQDTEVWIQASDECREKLRIITRKDVEARITQCINQVWHGGKARAAVHTHYVEKLRFTVGPHLYEHEYTPAPPDLVMIKGYDDAERYYTTSNHEWMSYFLYMAKLKNYNVLYERSEEDEDDLQDVKEEFDFCCIDLAQREQASFQNLDVSQFRDPVSIQTLEWVASGKFFKGHKQFFLGLCTVAVFTAYTAVLDTAVTVAVLHRQG
jgi:Origin of replication binding protein